MDKNIKGAISGFITLLSVLILGYLHPISRGAAHIKEYALAVKDFQTSPLIIILVILCIFSFGMMLYYYEFTKNDKENIID